MKVNEIFGGKNVVQGEGPFAGQPATFIRLWGCVPPYCNFCDTKYSWTDEAHESKNMSIAKIIKKVKKFGKNKLVVITGGEPFVQKEIYDLVYYLEKNKFSVQIETSGKAEINWFDKLPEYNCTIVMSPKQYRGYFILHKNAIGKANSYKFVVENEKEVKAVVKFVNMFKLKDNIVCQDGIYLMAKGETREKQLQLMPKVFKWCVKYGFKYSPRLHVLAFNVKRGV